MAGEYGGSVKLPPGFRFDPTDEELILHFLLRKAGHLPCHPDIIPDLDLSMHDPWQLHGKALWSEEQYYYFFSQVKEKSWFTKNGIWKEVDMAEKPVFTSGGDQVGSKKLYVFCLGDDHRQTNWLMQQYHLADSSNFNRRIVGRSQNQNFQGFCEWTVCRVQELKGQNLCYNDEEYDGSQLSWLDEMYMELDDDLDVTFPN